jgi:hypothetical protein
MSALDLVPAEFREGYMNQVHDLTRLAFKAQGTRALESTKRCAAIHEAGHCVVNTITARDQHGGAYWLPQSVRIWREPIKGLASLAWRKPTRKKHPAVLRRPPHRSRRLSHDRCTAPRRRCVGDDV